MAMRAPIGTRDGRSGRVRLLLLPMNHRQTWPPVPLHRFARLQTQLRHLALQRPASQRYRWLGLRRRLSARRVHAVVFVWRPGRARR